MRIKPMAEAQMTRMSDCHFTHSNALAPVIGDLAGKGQATLFVVGGFITVRTQGLIFSAISDHGSDLGIQSGKKIPWGV